MVLFAGNTVWSIALVVCEDALYKSANTHFYFRVAGSILSHDTAWLFLSRVKYLGIITNHVNSALHPSGVAKSSTCFGWGKGGKVIVDVWSRIACDFLSRCGDFHEVLYPIYLLHGMLYMHWPLNGKYSTSSSSSSSFFIENVSNAQTHTIKYKTSKQ